MTHDQTHNAMTPVYDSDGRFLFWQCTCGYRYGVDDKGHAKQEMTGHDRRNVCCGG